MKLKKKVKVILIIAIIIGIVSTFKGFCEKPAASARMEGPLAPRGRCARRRSPLP